jgi:surfeit locus 1 family protein
MQRLITIFWIAFVLIGAAVMTGLGFWQLERLQERRALNQEIISRIDLPPIVLTGDRLDPTGLEYRPAAVTGHYDFEQEIVLRNRAHSNTAGVHLITPLLIDGSRQAILVDRGWIPYQYASSDQRRPYQTPTGTVTVTGLIRLSQTRASVISPADPAINADHPRTDAWYWLDIDHIQQQFRDYQLLPFYLEQDPQPDATALPAPEHTLELDDGPHLSYAIQWFAFAVILVVGSIALAQYNRKRAHHAR